MIHVKGMLDVEKGCSDTFGIPSDLAFSFPRIRFVQWKRFVMQTRLVVATQGDRQLN